MKKYLDDIGLSYLWNKIKSTIRTSQLNNSLESYYGIQWTDDTTPIRIGNTLMHQSLPIQSQMKRCMVQDDGTIYGYISSDDYTVYEDGVTEVDYTGAHGQYMVEVPEYWYKGVSATVNGINIHEIRIYPQYVSGAKHSPKLYVGAVEASSNDSSSDTTKKLFSICTADVTYNQDGTVNASNVTQYSANASDYIGGNRTSSYTGVKSLLGRPVTNLKRSAFRTRAAARGTGWSQQYWFAYMAWVRLYVVEYCTFDSQKEYNSQKTPEGYMQGGLGAGVSTVTGSQWNSFNSYNPFIPCGVTKSLGNDTGVVTYKFASGEFTSSAIEFQVPSYRGIENPFGHIWKWTDGVNCYGNNSTSTKDFYVCDDITKFADDTSTNYRLKGSSKVLAEGYIKQWIIDEDADFMPINTGGSSSSYLFDYSWLQNTDWRVLYSGGSAHYGASCGLFAFYANSGSSIAAARIGGRLYFTPSTE